MVFYSILFELSSTNRMQPEVKPCQAEIGKGKNESSMGRRVTLISEMDLFLRNGRNGDFFYEMELQNPNLMSNISLSCFNTRVRQ